MVTSSNQDLFSSPSDGAIQNRDQSYQEEENIAAECAPLIEPPDSPQLAPSSNHNLSSDGVLDAGASESTPSDNPDSDQTMVSPPTAPILLPVSPYDPTLTPSFRHSPPRLPSDQPWRFPSPSHPLHSRARELCLGMLVRGGISPAVKASTSNSSSPSVGTPSIIRTPSSAVGRSKPFNDAFGSSPVIFRASPRQLFT
ncbi:hypothetical protein JVU11DRAFT_5245 [Chiua virens]|nr:hypothetical protein JVU11DRAFT_5245 [Chiua virens]